VHPAPRGNAICAAMIDQLMQQSWKAPLAENSAAIEHAMPEALDPLNYGNGRFIDPKEAKADEQWKLEIPEWKNLKGSTRDRFREVPMLCSQMAGAQLKLDFTGTAVGAFVVAGPDAGTVEARVDD